MTNEELTKLSKIMAQELNGTPQFQWPEYIMRRLVQVRDKIVKLTLADSDAGEKS